MLLYKDTKLKRKEKKKNCWKLIKYKGVAKALVISKLIVIFYAGHGKS